MYCPKENKEAVREWVTFRIWMNFKIICFCTVLFPLFGQEELRRSIFFDGGSYDIESDQAQHLANWLDSIPNLLDKYQIELISHTDPVGGRRFNQWLSRMRSAAVRELLIRRFIPEELIHIRDWGYDRPVYDNTTSGGRVMNRRVDVIVRPLAF